MNLRDTDGFSLGVFLLQSSVCILLNDYLGMHVVLKVLLGTVHISCMDQLETGGGQRTGALCKISTSRLCCRTRSRRPCV
jgi:cysteamine dioxygenase